MNKKYQGLDVELDQISQIEFNRRKNVQQDSQIATLQSQISQILNQSPAGFLPRVFYGLTRGDQTYRFIEDYVINISLPGNVGDAFELAAEQTDQYINAIAVKINETQVKIYVQGDYIENTSEFTLINMTTGESESLTIHGALALQEASYLGQFDANDPDNRNKQITVINDLETNSKNVVFASVDYSGDGVYNWVKIGSLLNGKDGKSIYIIDDTDNIQYIEEGDIFIYTGSSTTYEGVSLIPYDLVEVGSDSITVKGNIKGPQGIQGEPGEDGQDGQDGSTPTIQDGYWYINGVSTGVKAIGEDGTDGQDGVSFDMQTGLYSVPANWGETGNVGPNGETLLQLPALPTTGVEGKAYVVYDPLTTPLKPYYDLYYTHDNISTWTIIHPFSGAPGRDGTDGYTPYIYNGYWYINGTSTGVPATGPQGATGATGPKGVNPKGAWVANSSYTKDDIVTYNGSAYICKNTHTGSSTVPSSDSTNWQLFVSKGDTGATGSTGATGATPVITATATQLAYTAQPTVTVSGTTANPILNFGIPQGTPGTTPTNYIKATDSSGQTVEATGTDTPLNFKGNSTSTYIGFKNSSNTTLGYIGVNSSKKPVFYDTADHKLAYSSDIPTKVSQLTNDSGFTTNAGTVTSVTLTSGTGITVSNSGTAITGSGTRTITNAGVRSISTGSTNGTISVNTNGTSADVAVKGLGSNAYTSTTIPTKTSQLTNDSGFLTSAPVTSVSGRTGAVSTANLIADMLTGNASYGDKIVGKSIGQNGYIYYQSGLCIQWGRTTYGSYNNNNTTVNFPTSFTAVYSVVATWQKGDNTTREWNIYGEPTTTSFTVRRNNSSDTSSGWSWVAIGKK